MKRHYLFLLIFDIFILISFDVSASATDSKPSPCAQGLGKVKVEKRNGKCVLLVNEKEFFITGIGFSLYSDKETAERYFKLAKEMGANSVRQWGVTPNESAILDLAQKYRLMVNLGLWISWNRSYIDASDKRKEQVLEWVRKHKDHPALLLWNLGNENIAKIQKEEERIAFSKYIESVAKEVHLIDPNHPIVYTDVVAEGIPYLKYMPSIDIYGFNAYKAIEVADVYAKRYHLDRPYIYSEFGPDGWWEVQKDGNGAHLEPSGSDKMIGTWIFLPNTT